MNKENHIKFIRQAIDLALNNAKSVAGGGPFGALIVKDGEVIAATANSVTVDNDPTAHAEVNAIRSACKTLGTFDLSGCTLYTSCEPCPMCLSAIYWARISEVYYAAGKDDAADAGFDDAFIYEELALPKGNRKLQLKHLEMGEALDPFNFWKTNVEKVKY